MPGKKIKHKQKLLVLALFNASLGHSTTDAAWQHKVNQSLRDKLATSTESIELIVRLQGAHLSDNKPSHHQQKVAHVVQQLKAHAQATQAPVIQKLKSLNISYRAFWVSNDIWISAEPQKITELLALPEVRSAYLNEKLSLQLPAVEHSHNTRTVQAIEWNVSLVRAPEVWDLGYNGQDIVIAGQDTGYKWDHPALINTYRGWNGSQVDHNYNWHDSITNPNIDCETNGQPSACDDHGHGSHTMGTMIGDDGVGNQIGVAPGARWIGCRNMNQGNGTPATYMGCFQWFLEPTDINGQNPDTSKAPHVINNSWGCPGFEGCNDPNVMLPVVENVTAAGILVVSAAGNSGSSCSSVDTPTAIYEPALTVGSSTSTDTISSFSSRGPVTVDSSNRLKPEVVAPGSSIRSARLNDGYGQSSGTSMAAPHVAGVAALLMSAFPHLRGQPEMVKNILMASAEEKTSNQTCGGVNGSNSPNNTFGWGRIDAMAAFEAADTIFANDFD